MSRDLKPYLEEPLGFAVTVSGEQGFEAGVGIY